MSRLLVRSAGVVFLLLTGCGVTTTTDQAYDALLIRQVGTGSNAVASVFPTLQAEAKRANSFSNPKTSQDTVLLFQGRLNNLDTQDMIRLGNANQAGAGHLKDALAKMDGLAASISGDRVDPSAHQKLSSGAKKFIAAWNGYLASSAAQVISIRRLFASVSPVYGQFQTLLRDAYQSTNATANARFDKARRAFLASMLPLYTRVQNSLKAAAAATPAAYALGKVVTSTVDAKAIVAKVNQEYPNGALATEFKRGS
jgi:hypothetical protein